MVPLLLLAAHFFLAQCETALRAQSAIFWDMTAKRNVSLEGPEFQSSMRLDTDCARQCGQNESCLAFTFREGLCQGHSKVMITQSPRELVLGEKCFVRKHSADQIRCKTSGVQTLVEPKVAMIKEVLCEDDWIVILRRQDGSVDFYKDWEQYVRGFGNIQGEFWFGLEDLHKLTSIQNYDLVVDVEDWDDVYKNATYTEFFLTSATDNYRLHVEFVGGEANDSLSFHSGDEFTTYDNDNDTSDKKNCAEKLHGAWWYNHCAATNLCGRYKNSNDEAGKDGISWRSFHETTYSLKFAQMKIRPV